MTTIRTKQSTISVSVNNCVRSDDWFQNGFTLLKQTNKPFNWLQGPLRYFTNSVTTHQPEHWPWKTLIRNHQNSTTHMTGEVYSGSPGLGQAIATYSGYDYIKAGHRDMFSQVKGRLPQFYTVPDDPASLQTTEADRKARMRLMQDLADRRRAFQSLTFLGELAETVRMLKRPASAFRDSLQDWTNSVKKLNRRSDLGNMNRALAGSWLEYVFGISPLIGDLENAKEAVTRTLDRYESFHERFSSTGESEKAVTLNNTFTYGADTDWKLTTNVRMLSQVSVRYYGQVYIAAILGNSLAQRRNLGISLNEFLPTVWELLPYSFLIDYFTNIGDLVEACNTYTGDVAWISCGIQKKCWVESNLRDATFCNNFANIAYPSMARNKRIQFVQIKPLVITRRRIERYGLVGVPSVNPFKDFRWEIPGVGSTKWINISALLASGRSTERHLRSISR